MTEHVQFQQVFEVPGLVLSTARFTGLNFDRHFHLDLHVGLVTAGVLRQRVNGKTVLHGQGAVVMIAPGEIHDGIAVDDCDSTLKTFRLSQELVATVAEEISSLRREPEFASVLLEDPLLAGHLVRLHDAMCRSTAATGLEIQTEWLTLMECLLSHSRVIVPETVRGSLSRIQWDRVKDYCFSHLAEKITLDELAGLCSLGRFQFLKQFRQTVGMTPHAWLLRLRLERACGLLSRSSRAIASVAQEVGFYDQSHFNRAFRYAYGVAPSSYRA
ncbi:MAG: AraC family transcriptional regulator [Paraburkholderia sp.]|uniref:AraC family transcriptional regulator n=1 Tax=Paraburkholderia sp. TaxID=1926495 RepID=UPI0011FF2DC5|nr:AraC family transcriptional regulator [Paraburkholderia sp.]TAM00647.1 MAG: AraC family transcriptional regulator [Paraburkholderia sp.]